MPKDSQYWKVYNQKRKEYLTQKKRASRAKLKEMVVDHPPNHLAQLVKEWQTATNYNCASTCLYSYCSNCWYFIDEQLVNYKGLYD